MLKELLNEQEKEIFLPLEKCTCSLGANSCLTINMFVNSNCAVRQVLISLSSIPGPNGASLTEGPFPMKGKPSHGQSTAEILS